jgi:hypothetical protein
MIRILAFAYFLCFFDILSAQPTYFAAGINEADGLRHLEVLTSDSLAGRETGTEGNSKAAQYAARHFQNLGLQPIVDGTYFQRIAFKSENFRGNKLTIATKEYAPMWDFYSFPAFNSDIDLETSEILFLGYGIESSKYNDYKNVDVKGKVLLIFNNEPLKKDSTSWITKKKEPSEWTTDLTKKVAVATKYGAKAVIIIDGNLQKNIKQFRNSYLNTTMRVFNEANPVDSFCNAVYISTTMARALIGDAYPEVVAAREYIFKKGRSKHFLIKTQFHIDQKKNIKSIYSQNVLGYIEGTDPKLKKELIVVSAHLDHLGMKGEQIYRGADDDASGTSAVLEIAEAFAEAKKKGQGPRRSVLCILFTGEEKGLLGSEYYTTYPVFPLENTVANVNIDMIGRVDDYHISNPNFIYVIGSDKLSSELHEINEAMNESYTRLELDYRYNDEKDPNRYYYRSDHYNFAKNNIPVVFYFNGTHEDYHRPTDTVDKINLPIWAKRAKLAFYTTWELANRERRIKVDKL